MKRFLAAVCFLSVYVSAFAQCSFTVNAGPDTTICGNQSAYLHGSVTPAGAYTYQWSPSASLTGSTTLTPVATPSSTTTYTLSVTGGGCTGTATMTVTVNGAALLLTASINPTAPVCPGTLEQLNAAIIPNVCGLAPVCSVTSASSVVGSGNVVQSGNQTSAPTLMGNYNSSGRNQILYTAAELTTALGGACTIDGVSFNIITFNSNAVLQNFTVSVACTNATSLSTFDNNLLQVATIASFYPVAGWNAFGFTQGYNWDGVSNLIVDVCWNDPGLSGSQNNKAQCTNTAVNTYLWAFSNSADMCGTSVVPTATTERPNIKFGFCQPNINNYPIQWTPATGANAVNKPDSSDPTAHPITSQAYTIAVTNGTCVSTDTVNATVDASTVSAGPDISSCPGAAVTLTATEVGTELPGPPTYTWTTLAGGAVGTGASVVVHPVANTTYVVSMAGGACAHTDTVNVTLGSLNVDMAVTMVTCNGLHNGQIVITASNGTPAYSYSWSANASTGNSNTATNLAPGTYTVTASDVNTCSGTATVYITQPSSLLNSGINTTQPVCFGGTTGKISIAPNGGTKPYSYAWNNGLPPDSAQTGLAAGNYIETTTDANGCTVSTTIPLTAPSQITFNPAVIQNVLCPGVATGKITVSPTGGTGAYTYSWSQNATLNSPTAQNLNAGTYIVTVTDANSCTASSSNAVTPASQIVFGNPTVTSTKCFGSSDGSASVSPIGGTAPYTYLWTPSNQTTDPATGLSAQTYTVVVTDNNSCTADTTLTVPQPGKIVITGDSTNVSCNGGSNGTIHITGTTNAAAPVTYLWSNAATTQNLANLPVNTYTVVITDANGCTATDAFNITEPPVLAITGLSPVNNVCFGASNGSLTANANGGTGAYSYAWSNFATTQAISNLAAGPYTVIVTDANSCTATASATITQPASGPVFGNAVVTNVLCNGASTGAITVNVTGGTPNYSYAWSAGAPQINNATVTGLAAGTYIVTATDAGGCTVSSSNTVNQPTAITFTAPQIIPVSCNGGSNGSAQVNPSGGTGNYTYTWNGVAGTDPEPGLIANTYTVVVTDANACTASVSIVVGQPLAIQDSIVAEEVLCYGGADGRLTAYAYGGNPPFSYVWGDGSTTPVDSELSFQNTPFSVTITDSRGCTATANATLSQPQSALSVNPPVTTQVTCPGKMDGTITATGNGGTPPYSFSVTKDFANFIYINNGNTATGLDSGWYYITFQDVNGCTTIDSAFIKYPIPDSFSLQVDSTSCFGPESKDGSITVTAYTANNMPYTYTIDNGAVQDTNYFGGLAAGEHQIIATNQFGCQTTLDTIVAQPGPAFVSILPTDTTLQLGQSITLQSSFGPYPLSSITSYNWVSNVGLSCIDCPYPVATPYSHVTQYILTVTYNGLCTVSDSMQIIVENQSKPFIPNSFSPNGDGNNDVFEVYGENIKTVNLRIFNRWGELVFKSDNQFNGWDGYYKGVLQMPGVYTYDAEIVFLDDSQIEKHGSITLIR